MNAYPPLAQLSLVNLTMALGIAVEFCAHTVHAFLEAQGNRSQRSAAALCSAGASVLSGITLTKFIGAHRVWTSPFLGVYGVLGLRGTGCKVCKGY